MLGGLRVGARGSEDMARDGLEGREGQARIYWFAARGRDKDAGFLALLCRAGA